MVKPLLHTRVRYSFELSQSPHWIAKQILRLRYDALMVKVDERQAERMPFHMSHRSGRNAMTISGEILKQADGKSCISFQGNVDVQAPDMTWQRGMVLGITFGSLYFAWQIAIHTLPSPDDFYATVLMILGIVGLLMSVAFIAVLSYWVLVREKAGKDRWELQQEMGTLVQALLALQKYIPSDSAEDAKVAALLDETG